MRWSSVNARTDTHTHTPEHTHDKCLSQSECQSGHSGKKLLLQLLPRILSDFVLSRWMGTGVGDVYEIVCAHLSGIYFICPRIDSRVCGRDGGTAGRASASEGADADAVEYKAFTRAVLCWAEALLARLRIACIRSESRAAK